MDIVSNLNKAAKISPGEHQERGGLVLNIDSNKFMVSPVWNMGRFSIQFAGLPQGQVIELNAQNGPVYLKIITGEVDTGSKRPFPQAGEVISTRVTEPRVTSVSDSILCFIKDSAETASEISSMEQLTMEGPMSDRLGWLRFSERFGVVTDVFDGLEAYMVSGFHLQDRSGQEVAYVHFWTTGKGADVSTHNHSQEPTPRTPAFAEIHLVLCNGTGSGGMYLSSAQDTKPADRKRTPMQAGEEHGPYFSFDETTGRPDLTESGAVNYPWHGWQGGTDGRPGESYDLVAAFEINPDFVEVVGHKGYVPRQP